MRATLGALGAVLAGLGLAAASDTPPSPSPQPAPSVSPSPAARRRASPRPAESPRPPRSIGGLEKKAPPANKVFGNEDLPSPSASAATTTAPATPVPPAFDPNRTNPGEGGPSGELYWRRRANEQRERIHSADENVRQLEEKVAALRNDLNPTNVMDPNREFTRQAQIRETLAEIEQAKQAAADARQGMDQLEEEARHKGIPPGWLRER